MFNKLFENWRRFVDEQKLDELAKYKKMNKENSNIFDILKKYINIPAQYFIQFSDINSSLDYMDTQAFTISAWININKLGINPKSKYNTPIGIYSYPLIEDILNKYENESLPFASDRKYVILFKSKNLNAVVHFSIQDNEKYYEQLLNNIKINPIFDKYKDKNKNFEKYIEQWKKDAKVQTYDGYFWNITRMIANENPKIWTYILRNLNIDGMVDYGESIIHDNEPAQAVFFGKDKIEIIEVFENPYEKEELDLESNLLNISDKLSVFNMTFDKDIIEISTGTSISIDEFDKQKKNEY